MNFMGIFHNITLLSLTWKTYVINSGHKFIFKVYLIFYWLMPMFNVNEAKSLFMKHFKDRDYMSLGQMHEPLYVQSIKLRSYFTFISVRWFRKLSVDFPLRKINDFKQYFEESRRTHFKFIIIFYGILPKCNQQDVKIYRVFIIKIDVLKGIGK